MSRYLQAAFDVVCKDAKVAEGFYVCLMEEIPFYGGPEEGGWWGRDVCVVAYQRFDTEEAAQAASLAIEELAAELSADENREYGEQCLREMEWLEARGLDSDWLPEPDGPSEFRVLVSDCLPRNQYQDRTYQ